MLMRGDVQRLIEHINPVFETAFNRIEALDERIKELEAKVAELEPKRSPGRPPKARTENSSPEVDNN